MKRWLQLFLILALLTLPVHAEVLLPILCYHRVLPQTHGLWDITPEALDRQMAWLAQEGYQTVTYNQWADHVEKGAPIPEKPIIITFDDGHKGVYTHALPILEKYGFVGVAFIHTNPIGRTSGNLNWNDVRVLHDAGWEIGNHTINHPFLIRPPADQNRVTWQRRELFDSRDTIEMYLGEDVDHFAWTYGWFDTALEKMAIDGGYRTLSTINEGINTIKTPLTRLRRYMIYSTDSLEDFAWKVTSRPLEIQYAKPHDLEEITNPTPTITIQVKPVEGLQWNKAWMEIDYTQTLGYFRKVNPTIDPSTGTFTYTINNPLELGHRNISIWIPHEDGTLYVTALAFILI